MKAVILLHGFLSDEDDFAPLVPYLQNYYDKIELLTFPGHGGKFSSAKFTIDNVYTYLDEAYLLLQKEYTEIDVIGFSMGGALGLYLTTKYHVNNLILLAPAYHYINVAAPFIKLSRYIKINYQIKRNNKNSDLSYKEQLKQKLKHLIEDDKITYNIGKKFLIRKIRPYYFTEFRKIIKKVNTLAHPYDTPTLIMYGELDQIIPKTSINDIFNLCQSPLKKMIIYEDITHLMLLSSNKEKLIKDIINFIEERRAYA